MAAKRKLKLEYDDYTDMDEVGSANVHGVITQLSPIKKSKKGNSYYNGQVCDGKNSVRFVGFATNHQKTMQDFLDNKKSIELHNCQIKRSNRDSDKMEIVLKGATKINTSPKKFDVSTIEFQNSDAINITLDKVDETEVLTIINVEVKVYNCEEPVTLGTRQKQEVLLCDASGWATLQLWEENIGSLENGKSYKLKHFRVVEFNGVKYIAMCWKVAKFRQLQISMM